MESVDGGGMALSVKSLTVQFGGVIAVNKVSLSVATGTLHGLIGPNGAGKTTLVDAMSGFARSSSGSVQLLGEDIGHWPTHRRARRGLSRTFQNLELFNELSVAENLNAAASSSRRRSSDWTQNVIEMLDLQRDLPARTSDLPHGRRRMVSLARALVVRPLVLLLDEPAAGLDTGETAALGTVLRTIVAAGITILLVDHDMGLIMNVSDTVTVLESGRVLSEGEPSQVLADERVREVYLGKARP
jgi:ABC-type branched-subunit amino acid transport system ATPase component